MMTFVFLTLLLLDVSDQGLVLHRQAEALVQAGRHQEAFDLLSPFVSEKEITQETRGKTLVRLLFLSLKLGKDLEPLRQEMLDSDRCDASIRLEGISTVLRHVLIEPDALSEQALAPWLEALENSDQAPATEAKDFWLMANSLSAQWFLRGGKREEASQRLKKVFDQIPAREPLSRPVSSLLFFSMIQLADAHANSDQVPQALAFYQRLQKTEELELDGPQKCLLWLRLAEGYRLEGSSPYAAHYFEELLALADTLDASHRCYFRAKAHLGLALVYRQWNNLVEARDAFFQAEAGFSDPQCRDRFSPAEHGQLDQLRPHLVETVGKP
jgi:tetratricopeptide (TPR) repeat protein